MCTTLECLFNSYERRGCRIRFILSKRLGIWLYIFGFREHSILEVSLWKRRRDKRHVHSLAVRGTSFRKWNFCLHGPILFFQVYLNRDDNYLDLNSDAKVRWSFYLQKAIRLYIKPWGTKKKRSPCLHLHTKGEHRATRKGLASNLISKMGVDFRMLNPNRAL